MSLHKRKITIASKKATHWHFQRLKKFLQNKTHQKIISLALVLALITNASPAIIPDFLQGRTDIFSRTAQAAQQQDLILVLADEELMSDRTVYNGLSDLPSIRSSTIASRIERYSTELQQRLHNTKVEIITVSKQDDPATIAAFLKQAYLRNVDANPIQNRYLQGIVLMGQVPLPIVDKNGNRFPSIYPYTDFVDPAYTYNLETGFFELSRQNNSAEFEPEIWHGIIDFSSIASQIERTQEEIRNDLATYLDKNYLYHSGDPNFADFDSKIFYSEPVHEKNALDQVSLSNYEKYQTYSEELLYNRFSQKLFNEVTGADEVDLSQVFPPNDGETDLLVDLSTGFPESDITTRLSIEDQLVSATDLFQSTLGKQISALIGTGKFTTADIFTPIVAIAQKDDYVAAYFKMINQLVEARIDSIVSEVQQNLQIPNGAILSGEVTYVSSNGTTIQESITPQFFLNNSPEASWLEEQVESLPQNVQNNLRLGTMSLSSVLNSTNTPLGYIQSFQMQVFGRPVARITSANQCRIYRGGGTENPLDKTVKTTRGLYQSVDMSGNPQSVCYLPYSNDPARKFSTYNLTGNRSVTDSLYCSDFFGTSMNQPQRVQGVESINKGALTHESCFNMRPLNQFNSILNLKYGLQTISQEQILEASNQQVDVSTITLQVSGRQGIPLQSVLASLEPFSDLREVTDWNAWSYYLLGNPVKNSFTISEPGIIGISSITLDVQKVTPVGTSSIPSFVKHADPTDQMLTAVNEGEVTFELPINATRYITFVDRNGDTQEIRYPNVFKANSFEEFMQEIADIEVLFNTISENNYTNQLTSSLLTNQNQFNQDFTRLAQADQSQLRSFMDWSLNNLNQKYSQVYRNFLNSASSLDLIGFPKSFQIAVITSETDEQNLNLNILPENLSTANVSSILNSEQFNQEEQELITQIRDSSRQRSQQPLAQPNLTQASSCDRNYTNGVPVVEWFTTYIPCWFESVTTLSTETFSVQRSRFPTYQEQIANPDAAIQTLKLELIGGSFSLNQNEKIPVRISILDQNDNLIIGKPVQLTINSFGAIRIPENLDINPEQDGVQVFITNGVVEFNAEIQNSGAARLQAFVDSVVVDQTFTVHQDLRLSLTSTADTLSVASSEGINFTVQLLNQDNEAQPFYAPGVQLLNNSLGRITELSDLNSSLTEYQYSFVPNTLSGQTHIQVTYPGLEPSLLAIRVSPNVPESLYFKNLLTEVIKNEQTVEPYQIELNLVDEFSNKVFASVQNVNLEVTDSQKIQLVSSSIDIVNGTGLVQFNLDPSAFGNVFIRATHPVLGSALHQVSISPGISKSEFSTFVSPALYYELKLDTSGKTLAQNILSNGKAQVVSTISTDINTNLPVAFIQRNGALQLSQQASTYNLILRNSSNGYSLSLQDPTNTLVGELNVITSNLANIVEINSIADISPTSGIYVQNYDQELFSINARGQLIAQNDQITFEFIQNSDYFAIAVLQNSQLVSAVYYALTEAEVSFTPNQRNLNHSVKFGNTHKSTNSQQGLIVYDLNSNLSSIQKPGNSIIRADSALSVPNQGLHSGAKSLLFFSAGMTAGESNRSYLSDAGLLYGDPTISIEKSAPQNGFNQDIGKLLAKVDSSITHIEVFDDKILVADQNGNISNFDLSSQRFYKNLLNIPNGIKQMLKSNISSTESELIILTENGCFEDDSCLYRITINEGEVRTEPIQTNLSTKAKQIVSIDHNNNNQDDLIVLGENNILYFIRRTGQDFENQTFAFGNIYNQLQPDQILREQILFSSQPAPSNLQELHTFDLSVSLPEAVPQVIPPSNNNVLSSSQTLLRTNQNFTYYQASKASNVNDLTVNVIDLNGNLLRDQDVIEYRIAMTLDADIQNGSISVPLSSNETIIENSLRPGNLSLQSTNSAERPFIITGISGLQNTTVQVVFQTRYTAPEEYNPLLTVVIDETDETPDNLPDLKIVLNGQNKIVYYNSERNNNQFTYQRIEQVLETPEVDVQSLTRSEIPLQDPPSGTTAQRNLARNVRNSLPGQQLADTQALIGSAVALTNLADTIADRLQKLRCDGKGCLIVPVNRAFLVPSGVQGALPVFGAGCAGIPPVWPINFPSPNFQTCSYRQYISPTLTGEFVGASCFGPFGSAACWTYKIGDLGAACDAINQTVVNVLNDTVNLVNTAGGGVLTVGSTSTRSQQNVTVPGFPSVFTDWFTAQINEITTKLLDLPDITIIYPTVDSLIGYFSPVQEQGAQFENQGYLGVEDYLAKISTTPLFNITFKEYELKYPWIPDQDQYNRFLVGLTQYFEQVSTEVLRAANSWGCYGRNLRSNAQFIEDINTVGGFRARISNAVFDNPDLTPMQAEACIQLATSFDGFYASYTLNLEALKGYRDLPRNIFAVENFIADYADQALQIVEQVLDRSAGFLVENTAALIKWQQLFYEIQNLIDDFKVLIDFAIVFIANCDDCRTDRTNSAFGFLFEKIIGLPTQLPVIEFPKLPDITLDFSRIEAGVDIELPTFKFVPERVVLPDLGSMTLRLPDAIPLNFNLDFGQYGLSPMIALPEAPNLEQFIIGLPSLPDIELPVFPVLPQPPEIKIGIDDFISKVEVSLDALSALLRVVCIVFKGIIPTPEAFLRSKIESMTNRPLTPVLPIDLSLAFQFPAVEFSYISELKVIIETYFNYEFDLLAELPFQLVQEFNNLSLDTKSAIENLMQSTASTFIPSIEVDASELVPDMNLNFDLELDQDGQINQSLNDLIDLSSLDQFQQLSLIAGTEKVDLDNLKLQNLSNLNQVPKELAQKYMEIQEFRTNLDSRSSALMASVESLPFQETTTTQIIARNIPSFDSSAFASSGVVNPTFKPEQGIYFIPPNQPTRNETTQKLVAYSAESELPTNIAMADVTQNNAIDVIYSRGSQLFLKQNLTSPIRKTPVRGQVRTTSLSNFQSIDKFTLADNTVSVITENRNAIFSLPSNYNNHITVIDIFNSDLDSESKVNRYIINPFGSSDRLANFEPFNSFNYQMKTIPRDGFNQLYVKNSFTPNVSIKLENLNYRASISTLNLDTGSLQLLHQSLPITPNICGDSVPPVFGSDVQTNYTISLYERLTLDFSDVYDVSSEVVDIYLDTNSDGQRNFPSQPTTNLSRQFVLPPFANTGQYNFLAWAVDEAGNRSSININVNVVPPNLLLSQNTNSVSGEINPPVSGIPVSIVRERDGLIEEIATVNTNENGTYEFNDIDNSESIVIKDANNTAIFEINELTGSIKPLTSTANVEISQAENPGDLTTILLRQEQQTITTLTKVSDINLEVQVVTQKPSTNLLKETSNVFVINENINPNLQLRRIAGSDPNYAGAISLNLNNQRIAIFDTNGGIKLLSPQLSLRLQNIDDLTNYQWFEVIFEGQHVVSVLPTFAVSRLSFTSPTQVERVTRPVPVTSQPTVVRPDFQDVTDNNPNASIIRYLQENDVIEGIAIDGQRFFQPTRQITRAEYAKIILRILCLEPTPPSFQRPSVFSDIPFTNNLPWYFSETKETFLQNIFTGYLGEIDSISNLPPFKPNNPITLAEATKVVLEALVNQQILNLDSVQETEPWYDSFLEVAQDIRPYLRPGYLTLTDFVITAEEAQTPNRLITREEFAVIAFRVLQINNCLETNGRTSSLPISQPPVDQADTGQTDSTSTDSLENDTESESADSVSGISQSQNINNRLTNAGIYMQQVLCNTCPCQFRIEYLATLRSNDILFSVIRSNANNKIIQRSNILNRN